MAAPRSPESGPGRSPGCGPDIAYVVDPRFPGGTSAAVAAELAVAAGLGRVVVHARRSAMFGEGRHVAPPLRAALEDLRLPIVWDAPEVAADVVILHNPAFLKRQADFGGRILARHLVLVAHENFLRPGGIEGFDVGACLNRIDRAALALRKSIAPISAHNRATVAGWLAAHPAARHWRVLDEDWFNICDFDRAAPAARPRDRRGRHSRPGFEKFPPLADLDLCFPPGAGANVILGADLLIASGIERPHWQMLPFRSVEVADFMESLDFLVYFTAPTWRESFGRVIAEALAAGKVVLTDPETGAPFGAGVVACRPAEVDAAIARHIAEPALYAGQAARGQRALDAFSAAAFARRLGAVLAPETEASR